jgi:hypothetical protein
MSLKLNLEAASECGVARDVPTLVHLMTLYLSHSPALAKKVFSLRDNQSKAKFFKPVSSDLARER